MSSVDPVITSISAIHMYYHLVEKLEISFTVAITVAERRNLITRKHRFGAVGTSDCDFIIVYIVVVAGGLRDINRKSRSCRVSITSDIVGGARFDRRSILKNIYLENSNMTTVSYH